MYTHPQHHRAHSRKAFLILLIAICVASSACSIATLGSLRRAKSKRSQSNANSAANQQEVPEVDVVPDLKADAGTDLQAYEKYAAQMRLYLNQEKFDELDAIAHAVRTDKTRFVGGAWKLHKLYMGLSKPANHRKAPDAVWESHLSHLKKWMENKPESITARVALADAYVGYAWHARGNGFAYKVQKENWRPFEDRLGMAESVLINAAKLKAKCPHWYLTMQIVAKGQSWDLEAYDDVFNEGISVEPGYHYLYSEKAQFLLPRWYGEEGDWERFAEEASDRLGGKAGSILYYQIAIALADYYDDREFFTNTQISWPKVKRGFADLDETYGMSLRGLNEFCKVAGQSGEKAYTRALLARIGDRWDQETWTTREYFEHYKAWAASGD